MVLVLVITSYTNSLLLTMGHTSITAEGIEIYQGNRCCLGVAPRGNSRPSIIEHERKETVDADMQ